MDALTMIGLGTKFASGFLNSIDKSNNARQMAQNAYYEAMLLRKNAEMVRLNGALSEDALRAQNRARLAHSSAAMGEAGMSESPTSLQALSTAGSVLEQNVLNNRYQTESAAENYLYQARVSEENARIYRKKSKNRYLHAMLAGTNSALSVF